MRLDGLGKPAMVVADSQDSKPSKGTNNDPQVAPVQNMEGSGSSTSQNSDQKGPKLGVVLDLIQRAQEKKKKKAVPLKAALDAIKLYQRQLATEDGEAQLGQTLDLEV